MFDKKVLLPGDINFSPPIQCDLDDIDLILHAGLHAGKVSLTNSRQTLNTASNILHYDQSRHSAMRPNTIHDLIINGYTLRLFGASQYSNSLARLAECIESMTSRRVHINIYLTGPNVQGLAAHADPHDVLVCQLSGTKHWFVALEQGSKFHDFNITPGQMLFMPEGIQHYAANEDNSHSLHLSISLHDPLGDESQHRAPHVKTDECLERIRDHLIDTCRGRFDICLNENPYIFLVPRVIGKDLTFSATQARDETSIRQAVSDLLEGESSSFEVHGIEYIFPELLRVALAEDISLSLKVSCLRGEVASELISQRRPRARKTYFPSSLKHRLIDANNSLWILNPHCVLKPSSDGYLDAIASTISISLPVELVKRLQAGPARLDDDIARQLIRHNVVVPV